MGMSGKKWGLIGIGVLGVALLAVGIWMRGQGPQSPSTGAGYQHRARINNATRGAMNATAGPQNASSQVSQSASEGDGPQAPSVVERLESGFLKNAARFVVSQYVPAQAADGGTTPSLELTFRTLNTRYGIDLQGVTYSSDSVRNGRTEVLSALFQPQVITATRHFLGDRFAQQLVEVGLETEKRFGRGQEKPVTRAMNRSEVGDLMQRLGDRLRQWGAVAGVFSRQPDLFAKVESFQQAEQAVFQANFTLDKVSVRYERASQSNGDVDLDKLRQELEQAGAAYKAAIAKRESIRRTLVDSLRQALPESSMREADLLYLAQWLHRRRAEGLAKDTVLQTLGEALQDYGRDLVQRGGELQRQGEEIEGNSAEG